MNIIRTLLRWIKPPKPVVGCIYKVYGVCSPLTVLVYRVDKEGVIWAYWYDPRTGVVDKSEPLSFDLRAFWSLFEDEPTLLEES